MTSATRLAAVALAICLPLIALYLMYLGAVVANVSPIIFNWVEGTVLATQLARLAFVLLLPRFRRAPLALIFIIFSIEVLAMVPLVLLSFLLGNPALALAAEYLFISWPAAASLVLPPYAVYRLAGDLASRAPLSVVLPSAAAQFGLLSLLLSAAEGGPSPIVGLSGLTRSIASGLVGARPVSGLAGSDPIYYAFSVIIYGGLVTYFLTKVDSPPGLLVRKLVVLAFGSAIAVVWLLAGSSMTPSSLLLLSAPCALFTFSMWWFTRG